MILEDVGMAKPRDYLGLTEYFLEVVECIVLKLARFDFDYFQGILLVIPFVADFVHDRKATCSDLPQVLELGFETLNKNTNT